MSSIWRNSMPSSGSSGGGNTSSNKSKNQASSSSSSSNTQPTPGSTVGTPANAKASNITGKKKKTKKTDDTTSSNTGSTFFATSFIPMHSASLLKGITPIMPGPKTLSQGYLTMSSAPSLPPFPSTKTSQSPATTATPTATTSTPKSIAAYDSEEDLPSYSSNSSDQSDSSSDSSNSDSSDSYSSSSDSELKKKKKSKKSSKKKDDKKKKKKSKKKETKESTQSKTTQNAKNVEEEKNPTPEAIKKDQIIMPPPKPVVQEQPSSNANPTTPNASTTTPSTATSTDPPVRIKRKYTRRKDKEATSTTASTKETETQGKKKRKKREATTTEPTMADITSPKKKQSKKQAVAPSPSTQENTELTIYATEDDDKLFFVDRNEKSKKKSEDNDLFFGKNYNQEILRDELMGIPWCFVKESELNGSEKSNSIQSTTYLDAVVQESQFMNTSAFEVEDVEMKNAKDQIYEPVSIEGMNSLIPIELIQNPDLFKAIFSMNTWNNMKEEHRMFLKQFLPPVVTAKSSEPTQHNETIEEPTAIIEDVKEEMSSREAEESEWQELMNGNGMRHKKAASTFVVNETKQTDLISTSRKTTDSPLLVKTLTQLFNQTPLIFNQENNVTKLVKGIRNGIYHPSIQLEKQQMKYLHSINMRMEYHLFIECELLSKRRLSALQKMKSLKLTIPLSLTKPNQATLAGIEKRKQILAEKNSKIALPQVQNSMFNMETQMEPPTTTLSQTKDTSEKQKPTTSAPVKERKKPGPKPKKKANTDQNPQQNFEFVNFKASTSK